MLGLELVQDKQTKEPASELGALLGQQFTAETGVIVRSVGNNLIFSPPLVFTHEDCDEVAAAARQMLEKYGNLLSAAAHSEVKVCSQQ